jgi:hypothetical protein
VPGSEAPADGGAGTSPIATPEPTAERDEADEESSKPAARATPLAARPTVGRGEQVDVGIRPSVAAAQPGEPIDFVVTVESSGVLAVATVVSTLPPGVAVVAAGSTAGTCEVSGNQVTCSVELASGSPATIIIRTLVVDESVPGAAEGSVMVVGAASAESASTTVEILSAGSASPASESVPQAPSQNPLPPAPPGATEQAGAAADERRGAQDEQDEHGAEQGEQPLPFDPAAPLATVQAQPGTAASLPGLDTAASALQPDGRPEPAQPGTTVGAGGPRVAAELPAQPVPAQQALQSGRDGRAEAGLPPLLPNTKGGAPSALALGGLLLLLVLLLRVLRLRCL